MKFVPLAVLSIALIAPIVVADAGTFECTATIGLQVLSLTTGVVNIGGCNLVTTATNSVATAVNPADGCNIQADTNGDNQADLAVAVGTPIPGGSSVVAFCDLGVVDATSSITLANA